MLSVELLLTELSKAATEKLTCSQLLKSFQITDPVPDICNILPENQMAGEGQVYLFTNCHPSPLKICQFHI